MLIATIAIGISSCSKDAEESGTNPAGQTIATADGDIDWSVFEHLGENVVTDLKNLVGGPQTRAVSDFILSVTPGYTDIPGTGLEVTVTISKPNNVTWPENVIVRLAKYPNLDTEFSDLLEVLVNPTGENKSVTWEIPPFYSSTTNDSKILVYQYSIDGINWINSKIVLQKSVVGDFFTDLSSYENNRIPQKGEKINIYSNQLLSENATFRIRSLDDGSELADQVTIPTIEGSDYAILDVRPNLNDNSVIPFIIEYSLQNLPGEWIELDRGIQEFGELFVVTDVKFTGGSHLINAVGGTRTMQLVVESSISDEIVVRIFPENHSAYNMGSFTPITATAYKADNWEFQVEFPAARGATYAVGSAAGGWHASVASDLKSGLNGAGFWAVEYLYDESAPLDPNSWVGLRSFKQDAYYIGVRNDLSMLRKAGGDWILRTQGNWPANAVKFRAHYIDETNQHVLIPEITANSQSTSNESWEYVVPTLVIPQNDSGDRREWKFEYYIDFNMDGSGVWETWGDFQKEETPEYSWEGAGNRLMQYHF